MNTMRLIGENNYGRMYISDEEIISSVTKYLQSFFEFEINIASAKMISSGDVFPVFKMIVIAKSPTDFIVEKLNLIAETIDVFFDSNLGLKIGGIQVGAKYE